MSAVCLFSSSAFSSSLPALLLLALAQGFVFRSSSARAFVHMCTRHLCLCACTRIILMCTDCVDGEATCIADRTGCRSGVFSRRRGLSWFLTDWATVWSVPACKDGLGVLCCFPLVVDIRPHLVDEEGFLDELKGMLSDSNPVVVANAVAALAEISESSGKNLLHSILSKFFSCASIVHVIGTFAGCIYTSLSGIRLFVEGWRTGRLTHVDCSARKSSNQVRELACPPPVAQQSRDISRWSGFLTACLLGSPRKSFFLFLMHARRERLSLRGFPSVVSDSLHTHARNIICTASL